MEKTLSAQAVMQQLELYTDAVKRGEDDPDIRPLARAAARHLLTAKTGGMVFSELAPCLAIVWYYANEFATPFYKRWAVNATVQAVRIKYRARPMWNDFYMCLWMLSRNEYYVRALYDHLRTAARKNRLEQLSTAVWMIGSVSRQDPQFQRHWQWVEMENGKLWGNIPA